MMVDITDADREAADHVLIKRGLYYRPNNAGYTGRRDRAGLYPASDARPDCGVIAVPFAKAPLFSPACWQEVKSEYYEQQLAALQAQLAEREAEIERLRGEVEFWTASANANEEDALRKAVWRMGWPEINAYTEELHKGQDIREDGGGFFKRAIGRLFGVKPERDVVTTYQDAATAMIDTLTQESRDG